MCSYLGVVYQLFAAGLVVSGAITAILIVVIAIYARMTYGHVGSLPMNKHYTNILWKILIYSLSITGCLAIGSYVMKIICEI